MNTTTRLCVAVLTLSCIALGGPAPSAVQSRSASVGFNRLRLHVEVDLPPQSQATASSETLGVDLLDLPAEVVLELESTSALRALRVVDPQGNPVFGLAYARAAGLAGSEISIESEAQSLRELLARYPAGTYAVYGITADGSAIKGSVELSTGFPGQFLAGFNCLSRAVPVQAALLSWSPADAAASYKLEIENENLGVEFSVRLPATATSFLIPAQLLAPGQPYEYSLCVKGDNDNELEIEGSFTTAP